MKSALGLGLSSSVPARPLFDKAGLVLWLTAENYSAGIWTDKGVDAQTDAELNTGSQPILNLQGGANNFLIFNGDVGMYSPLNINLGSNHSVFVVFQYMTGQPSTKAILLNQVTSGYTLYIEGGSIKTGYAGNGLVSVAIPTSTKMLISDIYNTTAPATGTTMFLNGLQAMPQAMGPTLNTGSDLFIGEADTGDPLWPSYFKGSFYEILIFNRALGTTKRSAVDLYLKNKYEIA